MSATEFHVGDSVIIKSKEYLMEHKDQGPTVVNGMLRYAGKCASITEIVLAEGVDSWYTIDIDKSGCIWSGDWFEPDNPGVCEVIDIVPFETMF